MKYNKFSYGICFALLIMQGTVYAANNSSADDWALVDGILANIKLPDIPKKDFSILDYGAPTDGESDARPAILATIDAAYKAGGGRVILPKGKWVSNGPIHLKSRIDFHLSKGAHLLFSANSDDYLPVVKTRWEGTEVFTYSPLIYAANVKDVAISGEGIIDGNVNSEFKSWSLKQEKDVDALRRMGFDGVAIEKRVFGKGSFLRPPLIQFFHAERVLLEGYSAHNSPFWVNHLVYAKSVTVKNLRIDSHFDNNDGLDIDSSQFVLVEHNWFRTGDDSIVVKSGRDHDGRTIGIPSTDIVVRHNDMGGEDGIGLGSEMSGGIKRVFFTDNILRQGDTAIRIKSNLDRGGLVEMIRMRNFIVESFDNLFWFQMNYPSKLGGNFPSVYRDIIFEDFVVEKIGTVLEIHAPESAPLQGVIFKNISIISAEHDFVIENALNLKFENVKIGDQYIDGVLHWRAEK